MTLSPLPIETQERTAAAISGTAVAALLCLLCVHLTGDTFAKDFPVSIFLHGLTVSGLLVFYFLKNEPADGAGSSRLEWKVGIVIIRGIWLGYRVLWYTSLITPFLEMPVLLLAPLVVAVIALLLNRKKELPDALHAVALLAGVFTIPMGFIMFPYAILVAPLSGIFCVCYYKAIQLKPVFIWLALPAVAGGIYFTPWHQYLVLMLIDKT